MSVLPGTRLGPYEVLSCLGSGGMGEVYKARDARLGRSVAIKVLRPNLSSDADLRARFEREARVVSSLNHPHICTLHDIGHQDGVDFLVMEFLEGETLAERLERGALPLEQALRLASQIASALDSAHRAGIIHRDLKPGNVILTKSGAKLLDFGLAMARPLASAVEVSAMVTEAKPLTEKGTILGTVRYMSPEQLEGKAVDARSDLFAFGSILYEMVTGQRAFTAESPASLIGVILRDEPVPITSLQPLTPPALERLVAICLAKDPDERWQTARDLGKALRWIAEGLSSPSAVLPASPPARSPSRWLIAGAAALAAVALIGGALVLLRKPVARGSAAGTAVSQPAAQAVTEPIVLGMSAPLTGPAKELGRQMKLGVEAYFGSANAAGGVGGRPLKLLALDDAYEPARTIETMRELVEKEKVFAVVGNVGTPTAEVAVPYVLEKKVLFFGPFTGASLLRKEPPDRYVFNYRASYAEETAAVVRYLVEIRQIRPDQIAVFTQQDSVGDTGFSGVAKALRKYGQDQQMILRVGYPRNTLEVDDAVGAILGNRKRIRAVVTVATYRPAARFIEKVKERGGELVFTNVSGVGSTALAEELKQLGPAYSKGVIVTQVVPPIDSSATAIAAYRDALQKSFPGEKPDYVSLEGYIAAQLLTEGLKRAASPLTTESVINSLESIRGLDIGIGTPISYGLSEHQGSHKVWGTILDENANYRVIDLE
jgi:ABC-type branched-subunit amino acid transport system substrate-binding protein/predicted Ser/Thr protein kinase